MDLSVTKLSLSVGQRCVVYAISFPGRDVGVFKSGVDREGRFSTEEMITDRIRVMFTFRVF